MQTPNTLNITVGTDVILNVTLEHDGVVLNPALIDNLQANLITGLGRKTPLETSTGIDYIVVNIPWVDGRLPGCYSLEITGSINDLAWSAVGKRIIRYTSATEIGHSTVEVTGDSYDVTMEVGYYFTDSPIEGVEVNVDNGVGTPSAIPSYIRKELKIDFHNLKGNGIKSIEQTTTSEADHGVNVVTITDDLDNATNVEIRNGGIGPQGRQGIPGESAVFDPTTGNISVIEQTTGESITNPMSQKAITDEFIKAEKSIGEWEEIKVSLQPKVNCYPSSAAWAMRTSGTGKNEQRHVVVPVTGGEKILLTCVSIKDGSTTGSKYAWLTSAYDDTPPQKDAALPLASGETEARDALIADGEKLITAPTDAAYLCLTMAGWGGSAAAVTWEAKRKQQVQNLAMQVKYNTEDLDNAMKWVEHRNDVQLASGYINVNLLWNTTANWKGKVIPFEQYVGKRVKITILSDGANLNFAFLTAMPSNVHLSSVAFCQGWKGVVKEKYDGYVPQDCKYLYVLAKNGDTSADVTPHIETREYNGDAVKAFNPTQKIDLSVITDQLCSLGAAKFYMNTTTNEQRHIAIPVTPGETYRVRSIDGDGQIIVATSAYDNIVDFQNDTPIPTATGWDARVDKQENVFTTPLDGAYLLLTTVNGRGIRCTFEVEKGTLVEVPSKDLPSENPVKLRVVQWNIGGFTKGVDGGDEGYNYGEHEEDFYTDLPIWKDTINDMDADIICCCEYNKVMLHGENDEPDVIARDEIFGLYKHAYIQPKLEDFNMKAIFSHMAAKGLARTLFSTHRSGAQPYYETVRYKVNNNDVYVIATHLDWSRGDTDTSYRQGQMEELMAFAADKQYVIICADFNAGAGDVTEEFRRNGSKEYDQWLEAGFKMANHGYLGDFNTGNKVYSVLDNIIVKGFDVSNIKIYDDPNNTSKQVELVQEHQLSDHAAIGCTLTMLD